MIWLSSSFFKKIENGNIGYMMVPSNPKPIPPMSVNSVYKDLYSVLCAARSWWTWQSPFWILAFACTVSLNCQYTSQNAFHGCVKNAKKSNPIRILLWRTKISEAVCKCDCDRTWGRIYVGQKCWTQCAMTLSLLDLQFCLVRNNCKSCFNQKN